MIININNWELHNFVSYEQASVVVSDGDFIVLGVNSDSDISGSNGSGKSALFDALSWCIYGISGRNQISKDGLGETHVAVEASVTDGPNFNNVRIDRFYKHSSGKNRVELRVDGENVTAHTIKETQKKIENIIRISHKHFVSSVVMEQGMNSRLTLMTPTQRKSYFNEVVDFNWASFDGKIKGRRDVVGENLKKIESKLGVINSDISKLDGKIELLEVQSNSDVDKLLEEEDNLSNKIKRMENEVADLKKNISSLERIKSDSEKYVSSRNAVLQSDMDKYKKLSTGVCPLCLREYDKSSIDEINKKLGVMDKERDSLSSIKNKIDDMAISISSDKSRVETLFHKLRMLYVRLDAVKHDIDSEKRVKTDLSYLKKEYKEKVKEAKTKEDEVSSLRSKYDKYVTIGKLCEPSGKLRAFVLRRFVEEYNRIFVSIRSFLFSEFDVYLGFNENGGLDIVGADYTNLSGGEKRRLDILFQLAFSEFIFSIAGVSINLIVMDEVFDSLDSEAVGNIVPFITSFFGDGKSIFVISHDDLIKDFFGGDITVEKSGGSSRIL